MYVALDDADGNRVAESFQEVDINDSWGTITLDLPQETAATLKTVLIFPDPNNAASATFYVDNVRLDGVAPEEPTITINLTPETVTLEAGASTTLVAEVTPADADSLLRWSSLDTLVASVDSNGQVTALLAGSATVVASTADGTVSDSATVVVVPDVLQGDLVVADFDGVNPTVGIVEPGRTQAFSAGGTIAVVANPSVDASNPSAQVLRFDKDEGTFKLIGFNLQVGRSLNRYETFSFQIYGSVALTELLVVLNDPAGVQSLGGFQTVDIDSGTWSTVTIEIPEGTTASVKDLLIFPNPNDDATGTFYVDNVRFNTEQVTTYQIGDCTFTADDFPADMAEVVAVSDVPYYTFHRRETYMIGLITGIRTDGQAGAWELHNDCSIKPLRKSGFRHNTSLLPDVRGVDRRYGWRYEPTGISEDGKYIDAVAINDDGYTHPRGWQVEAGTMVDVQFRLAGSRLGRIFLVIGQVSCDKVVAKRRWFDYFVVRCDDDENARTASANGKLADDQLLEAVTAYPNPTTGIVTLQGTRLSDRPVTIRVINASGRVVLHLDRTSGSARTDLDLSRFADGLYTIQLLDNDHSTTHRVLLRK